MCKPQNTMNEDWDYLIIFDACRYDYFKEVYRSFFDGILEERKSPAIYTGEWMQKTFTKYYDNVAYISPVPFCNSGNKKVSSGKFYHKSSFKATDHFVKIYDLWNYGWNMEKRTVLPWTVTKKARIYCLRHPEWRFIIHYFQPHAPYIPIEIKNLYSINKENLRVLSIVSNLLTYIPLRLFGTTILWRIAKILNLNPITPMEASWRKYGANVVRMLYKKNLEIVMKHAKQLVKHLPLGKVVITADHGELLGENGYWGHGSPIPAIPKLVNIPWLEVERI